MTKRVLVCTIGSTVPIVTETVWALAQRKPPWRPDAVHVVTTSVMVAAVSRALHAPDGPLARLIGHAPDVTIHVPSRAGSSSDYHLSNAPSDLEQTMRSDLMEDVVDEDDAGRMGSLILQLVGEITADDATEMHLSLAGGRKTMSAHALLAITLLGRPRDEASHVIVSKPEFEGHPEFWQPEQGGTIPVRSRGAREAKHSKRLNPADAAIRLIPVPTPHLRHQIDIGDPAEVSLRRLVDQANAWARLETQPELLLFRRSNVAFLSGAEVRLGPKPFALLRLLARARKENWPGAGPNGLGPSHAGWLSVALIASGRTPEGEAIEQVFAGYLRDAANAEPKSDRPTGWSEIVGRPGGAEKNKAVSLNLSSTRSRLLGGIRGVVGPAAAKLVLGAVSERSSVVSGELRFGLKLDPGDIVID